MKKNSKKNTRKFKFLVIIIFLLVSTVICFKVSISFLKSSPFFRIKKITFPKSIDLTKSSLISDLIGKNLYSLDIKDVSYKIQQEFRQLNKIKIKRHPPDELIIEAEKRFPLASVKLAERYFYVDSEGIIISAAINQQNNLPIIVGVANRPASLIIGQIYDDSNLKFGLKIISETFKISYLKNLVLTKVNVSNLSRASFIFANGIEVIIGEDNINDRLQLLTIVFSRLRNELNQIKYIDLRFKEPTIGRK